jgi:hypothetical protein
VTVNASTETEVELPVDPPRYRPWWRR